MDVDEAEELLYAASQSRQNTSAFASLLFYAFVVLVLLVVTLACLLLRQRRDTESDARPDDDTVQQFSSMLNISPADAERMLTEMKTSKPSVIEKRLLLGNAACSADREALREARVAYIVNATSDLPNHCAADNIEYLRVPVEDALDADLLVGAPSNTGAVSYSGQSFLIFGSQFAADGATVPGTRGRWVSRGSVVW